MAVEIGALRAMLSLDSAAFDKGIKRARASMNGFQRTMSRTSQRMNRIGKTLTTRVTAPLVAATALFARSSLQSAARIERLSQVANAGTTEFQRFAAGARDVGIEQDKLADILKDTNDRIGDFVTTGGGPMADFFENIAPKVGVTAEQFAKLSGPEALQLYVSSLEKAGASQQEMTFYMEALASDATLLLPLLRNNGKEMGRLADQAQQAGAIMDKSTITALLRARDALREAGDAAKGFGNLVMASLAPVIEQLAEKLRTLSEWFSGLSPRMRQVAIAIGVVAAAAGPAAIAVGALAAAIGAISLPLAAVLGVGAAAGAIWLTLGENTSKAEKAMDAAKDAQKALNAALGTFYETSAPSAGRAAIEAANDNYQLAESAIAAAKAEIAKREAQLNALEGGVETSRRSGLRQGAQGKLDEARAQQAQAESMLADAERARNRAARAVTGSMSESMTETAAAASNLKVEIEGLGDVGTGSGNKVQDAMDRARQSIESASVASDRWANNMAGHFDGLITGGKKFSGVLQSMARQLESSAWQALFSGLGGNIFGGGGGGGFWSSLFGGIGSNATGTDNWRGGLTSVNERGGEIMNLPRGTQIIPHDISKRMADGSGGGRTVVQLDLSPDLEARILSQSGDQAVEINRQGFKQYDQQLPGRVKQINRDPRRT